MRGKNVPESLSKTSVKHNTFARYFFHTFFIRISDPFSRARAFYNFTFTHTFSHHMLDILMHTYVLVVFFTRTFWILFHTCILDMFSHPYFWPPCPIPSPSRGDLGFLAVKSWLWNLWCGRILASNGKKLSYLGWGWRQVIMDSEASLGKSEAMGMGLSCV